MSSLPLSAPSKTQLPLIIQQLGHGPLTFFKLYAPSYRCPNCGAPGLFVKVSANDGNPLTEYWDLEGPRDDYTNMDGVELHQGIAAMNGFGFELFRPDTDVKDHLDIFGRATVRPALIVQALVRANLRSRSSGKIERKGAE